MHGRRYGCILTMASVVALVVALPARYGIATKRQKPRMIAIVNGKRLKSVGPVAYYTPASFSINAASKPRRGLVRTVTANCGPIDIKAVAIPIAIPGCYGTYTEAGSRHGRFRQWTGTSMEVTVDSFDGTRIVGTFQGTLDGPTQAGDPPATVAHGTYSIALTSIPAF